MLISSMGVPVDGFIAEPKVPLNGQRATPRFDRSGGVVKCLAH